MQQLNYTIYQVDIESSRFISMLRKSQLPLPTFNKCLGSGVQGRVYQHTKNKVIKIAVSCDEPKKTIQSVLSYAQKYQPPHIAKIYEHKFVASFKPDHPYLNTEYVYYIISEKLFKIEYKYTNILDDVYYEIDSKSMKYALKAAEELKHMNELFHIKTIQFIKSYFKYKLRSTDLHFDNVMKDRFGNLKICDLGWCKIIK